MDSKVTIRFYQVQRHNNNDTTFSEALQQIHQNHYGQYEEIDADLYIRLERYVVEQRFIKGEFTRKQTVNLPPKVVETNTADMLEASDDPIAHRAAFQYDPATGILALEYNRQGMTLPRINTYIIQLLDHAGFEYVPVITEGAWEVLMNGTPKKLMLRIAHPENLNVANNPSGAARALAQQLNSMKEIFSGPVIEASVGFGRKDGHLNKTNVMSILRFLRSPLNVGLVEKAQVKIEEEQEPVDLLTEQLKFKQKLELDDEDIDAHYQVRKAYIEHLFRENRNMLNDMYGRAA